MGNNMNMFETAVVVTKNVVGLTAVAVCGLVRKYRVQIIGLTAVIGYVYLIF